MRTLFALLLFWAASPSAHAQPTQYHRLARPVTIDGKQYNGVKWSETDQHAWFGTIDANGAWTGGGARAAREYKEEPRGYTWENNDDSWALVRRVAVMGSDNPRDVGDNAPGFIFDGNKLTVYPEGTTIETELMIRKRRWKRPLTMTEVSASYRYPQVLLLPDESIVVGGKSYNSIQFTANYHHFKGGPDFYIRLARVAPAAAGEQPILPDSFLMVPGNFAGFPHKDGIAFRPDAASPRYVANRFGLFTPQGKRINVVNYEVRSSDIVEIGKTDDQVVLAPICKEAFADGF